MASIRAVSISLLLQMAISPTAFAICETPGSREAFAFEPYAFVKEVYSGPEQSLWDQGYNVDRLIDDFCDFDPGETTLTSFKDGLRHGYGVFCVSSHGDATGFGVEVYPPDTLGFAAADSAYWAYRSSGNWLYGEIYLAQSYHGWSVAIRDSTIASSDKGFVSSQSLVYASPCSSWYYRWAWTGARAYLGCDYDIDIGDSETEADLFWDRMNGEYGKDKRCVAAAKSGLTISHQDSGATVLAPAVLDFWPATHTSASPHFSP